MSGGGEEPIKLPDHTLPSDYSDVHPKTYDPEFISQINSQMQVPHRIAMHNSGHDSTSSSRFPPQQYQDMMVPDRIVVAGDNQHLALKSDHDLKQAPPVDSQSLAYVGLMTPPRRLTVEEGFPNVDQPEEVKSANPAALDGPPHPAPANGYVTGETSAFSPGTLDESLLLNGADEAVMLQRQVLKLTRRVQVIEQDNQRRAQRERVVYPLILGFFLWKVLGWLVRDR